LTFPDREKTNLFGTGYFGGGGSPPEPINIFYDLLNPPEKWRTIIYVSALSGADYFYSR